jgi:hypothetical protein
METSENLEGYNPQEEIKKFWPSKTNNLGDNQKEISLIVLPNSKIFNEVSSQLRKWSALGIIRPFLLINAEDFQLKENETDADILRKNCEFIFPSFFKSIDDSTKLINPLFPYLADLGEELNLIRLISVLSPDLDKGSKNFFEGINKLKKTLEDNKNSASIKLFTTRLVIPTSRWLNNKNKTLQGTLDSEANVNLLVSPEDRPAPGAVNQGVLEDNYVSHASFYISTAANLWLGSQQTPFDNYTPNNQGMEDFRLMRGFGRLVVSGDIVERVATGIKYDDGNYRTPNTRVNQTPRLGSYVENKAKEFFQKHVFNSSIQNSPNNAEDKDSSFQQFIKYFTSRLRFNANALFYAKDKLEDSVLKEEVESLSDISEFNIDDSFLSRVSESLVIEKGIDVSPKDSSIYEDFIFDLFAEVDGSNLLIEDNRDSKFELILNAHHIASDKESLMKKILSKVSNYKSSLGSAFAQWFQLFHAEYIKDIDGSVQKLLNVLKRLRGLEVLSIISIFLNLLWLCLHLYQENGGSLSLSGSEIVVPYYLANEGAIGFLVAVLIFIVCTIYGYIYKNKVFGTKLSIFQIKNNLETILIEFQRVQMVEEHLSDWSIIANDIINNPFINQEINEGTATPLKEIQSIAKSFQIAEGEINPLIIEDITSSFTKQGWLVDLYNSNLPSFSSWRTEQNKPIQQGVDLKKSLYTDLSRSHQQGLRSSLREYVLQGLATLNGRLKLEKEISNRLQKTKPSDVFGENITVIEERGEKPSTMERFFGELEVGDDPDMNFLSGIWTNKELVDNPENTKVEKNIIYGDDSGSLDQSTEQQVQFMDLELAVKAGTPIQSLYLRIDISEVRPPESVGKWDKNFEPFEDLGSDEDNDVF